MKFVVWMIREISKVLNQYAVNNHTLPVNPRFSLSDILAECLAVLWEQWWAAKYLGHAWKIGHVMSERQTPVQDQRCQSGPSARNSFVPSEGRFSKNYGADQQRLQISDPHFDKFPTSATFACWKMRFKTEVCTCSQFPTEAMMWIKEVEMVESVDDLNSLCSIKGVRTPDFEVLDAKIASALNRIIHNTRFKRKVSLEEMKAQKEDRFLRGRQIAYLYLIYEYFRVTGANDSVENYCRPIYNCSSKWWYSGIRFEMGRNSIINDQNPIWWHLGRIVQNKNTRVWETQDRIGIVQYGDSSEEKAGPDYHRLKTMVKRGIEQNLRIKNFEARNGNYETNAVVKNQGTKQREQRTLGLLAWKANGQCSKGDNCSFRHDINKRAKTTQPNPSPSSSTRQNERNASRTRSPRGKSPSGRMFRLPCKYYLKGTCTTPFCEKWHAPECLFYNSESGCRFGRKVLLCASTGWRTA